MSGASRGASPLLGDSQLGADGEFPAAEGHGLRHRAHEKNEEGFWAGIFKKLWGIYGRN